MGMTLLDLALGCYFIATLAVVSAVAIGHGFPRGLLRAVLSVGGVLHLLSISQRSVAVGTLAVTSTGEVLSLLALLLVAGYLVLEWRAGLLALGAVVVPLAFGLALYGGTAGGSVHPIPPMLRSLWLPVHVSLAVLGDALFAFAFAASFLYLAQERRLKIGRGLGTFRNFPSLETLDRVSYRCLVWGLVLCTLGIVTGIVWAHEAWEEPWTLDAKLVFTLGVWTIYVVLLQGRMSAGWRGRWAAQLTVAGFVVVVVSLIGLRALGLGSHTGVY
jgi:cytochrome c-type biogenesis protein CcsB